MVPISICYERIPDQAALANEVDKSEKSALNLGGTLRWLKHVFNRKLNIGRIHVQAAQPVLLSGESADIKRTVRLVQKRQKEMVCVSDFHLRAGAKALGVSTDEIRTVLERQNCRFWHSNSVDNDTINNSLELPRSETELWTIMLQYGHFLSPLFSESRPQWSKWLDPSADEVVPMSKTSGKPLDAIVAAMTRKFDEAEHAVKETLTLLQSKGFSSPSREHLAQYVRNEHGSVPSLLISPAISIVLDNSDRSVISGLGSSTSNKIVPIFKSCKQKGLLGCSPTMKSAENFGAWGYNDSRFIFTINNNKSRCVVMQGNRYDICGRKLSNIIPFLESETKIKVDPQNISLPTTSYSSNFTLPGCDIDKSKLKIIRRLLGNDKTRVSTASIDRIRHGTGHTHVDMFNIRSGSFEDFRLPDVVVWPTDEKEVADIVKFASNSGICLIPFGGGTNVSHSTWCPSKKEEPRPIISVDMKLMDKILCVNEEDGTACIQAGITGAVLVNEMKKIGLTIGHEPDSIEFSTLGGWVATKASGMKQNKYGNIEDIVMNVQVAGANGLLWQNSELTNASNTGFQAYGRVSTGLDLKCLMLGSEGCLGIITCVVIKVWPLPECKEYDSVLLANFQNGIDFMRDVARLGALKPASIRLVDNEQFRMAKALKAQPSAVEGIIEKLMKVSGSLLYNFSMKSMVAATITYEGAHDEICLQKNNIKKLVKKHGGISSGSSVGKSGYELTFAIAYLRDFAMTYYFLAESFETFVPWSKLERMVSKTKQRIRDEHKSRCLPGDPIVSARVTQLYDNGACVYFYFCMNYENVKNPSGTFSEIEHCAREEIMSNGGSLSHHHGIGKLRSSFMEQVNSKKLKNTLLDIKKSIDPKNIFGAKNGTFSVCS